MRTAIRLSSQHSKEQAAASRCIFIQLLGPFADAFRNAYASSTRFFSDLKIYFARPTYPLLAFSRAGRYILRRLCILHPLFLGLEDTFRDASVSSTCFFSDLKIHFARPTYPLLAFSRAGRYILRRQCILYSLFLGLEDTFCDAYASSTCFFAGWKIRSGDKLHLWTLKITIADAFSKNPQGTSSSSPREYDCRCFPPIKFQAIIDPHKEKYSQQTQTHQKTKGCITSRSIHLHMLHNPLCHFTHFLSDVSPVFSKAGPDGGV